MPYVSLRRAELQVLRRVPQIARLLTGYAIRGPVSFDVAVKAGRLPLARWIDRVCECHQSLDRPIREACASGHHRMVLWLFRRFGPAAMSGIPSHRGEAHISAAVNGHVRVLYAIAAVFPLFIAKEHGANSPGANRLGVAAANACHAGRVGVAMWLCARHGLLEQFWWNRVLRNACNDVNLPVLAWIVRMGMAHPLDGYTSGPGGDNFLTGVAELGWVAAARWLAAHYKFDHVNHPYVPQGAVIVACAGGHLPLVRWLVARYELNIDRIDGLNLGYYSESPGWRVRALMAAAHAPEPAAAHWVLTHLIRGAIARGGEGWDVRALRAAAAHGREPALTY